MSDDKTHSLLSPSSAHRFLNCTPSARLAENHEDSGSSYAQEGTIAHSYAERKLKYRLGLSGTPPVCEDAEMDGHTDDYVAFVLEQLNGLTDPQVFVEQKVDCSRYVPECRGTCDALIISDGILHVCDFKYGRGVQVDAEENDQLRLYALGAIDAFECLFDIHTVRMSIFQPRIHLCSTWEVSRKEIDKWAEDVLIPTARIAWDGGGEQNPGDWCQFCKIKGECRKRAEVNLEIARYEFRDPARLEMDEIAEILAQAESIISWAGDVQEFALKQALNGVKYTGFKIVSGRSNRRITDDVQAAKSLRKAGYKDIYKPKELLGIGALEKLCGAKFTEVLGTLIVKPQGKPALVPETDKRQAITVNSAANDFADQYEN
jgi:hypothetical protein